MLLRKLTWRPLPRADACAADELGVPTAAEQVAFLSDTAPKESRWCLPLLR
ncbi:hypothetical protein [Streptomyces flaveolus]|uniref:hypothetical protein n=1 Tax=Streptomyces flaveolus TaxID=67297 RepID=UPI00340DA032